MTTYPSSSSRFSHRAAFTLIELLVVLGIIGILAALIVPAIFNVRKSALTAKSVSNMRQITTGFLLYAQDNGGLLPCATHGGAGGNNPGGLFWMQEISPFISYSGPLSRGQFSPLLVDPVYAGLLGFSPLDPSKLDGVDARGGYSMNIALNHTLGLPLDQYGLTGNWKFRQPLARYSPSTTVIVGMGYYEGLELNRDGTEKPVKFSPAGGGSPVYHGQRIGAGSDGKGGSSGAYGFLDGSVRKLTPTEAAEVLKRRS